MGIEVKPRYQLRTPSMSVKLSDYGGWVAMTEADTERDGRIQDIVWRKNQQD